MAISLVLDCADPLRPPWRELTITTVSIVAGAAYLVAARRTVPAALSGETVVLWALAAVTPGVLMPLGPLINLSPPIPQVASLVIGTWGVADVLLAGPSLRH